MTKAAPHHPPFRAEHIGSLLRPADVLESRRRHAAGEITVAELRAAEDAAIRDAVVLQERLGFSCVTDGEYRRSTYSDSFTTSGLVGVTAAFSGGGDLAYTDRHGHRTAARIPTVHGRLEWGDSGNAHDFRFLASLTDRLPKMTLPGPGYIHFRSGRANISREAYPDLDEFWVDLVGCYHKELAALGEAGCRYVQLDETSLAKFGDPKIRRALTDRGDNWENLLEVYIRAINAVVEGAPAGMRIGVHLCRGNNRGHWQAEGGYDLIAAKMFADVAVDFFFLEYDSTRAGTFAPLAEVPDGKTVVLGLVSTKVGELEPADLLKRRLEEASRYVPFEQLALSPQCGFASAMEGNPISSAEQEAKLRQVVEVARAVWGG